MGTYDWADDEEGLSLAYVRGSSLCEVGDVLGFRWETEREATWTDAVYEPVDTGASAVMVAELDGWLVVNEVNGAAAAGRDTVARLSRGGIAVSVFWNVNAVMCFALARHGELVRWFDPLLYEVGPMGQPLPEEAGLTFGVDSDSPRKDALVLAGRLTGLRPERDWLMDRPHRTWTTQSWSPQGA